MRRTPRDALMVSVWAELGAHPPTECYIASKDEFVDGQCDLKTGRVWISPVHQTVDSIVHEILHRLHPSWSDPYVRGRATYLRRRMTDAETRAFYEEYQKRKRARKSVLNGDD